MSQIRNLIRQPKTVFLAGILVIYTALIIWLDLLQGTVWHDEGSFWGTSLTFSNQLLPSIEDLKDYRELNTPLPFMIFGALEYLFHGGIFSGRLLNLILSIIMTFMIGWPSKGKNWLSLLSLAGLFMCPYYLWLSGRLYTEMLACFFVLTGVILYLTNRHILSSISFILAISTRQYMLAFPVGIAVFEAFFAFKSRTKPNIKIIFPIIASLSILGWFALFGGLAPATSYEVRQAPDVQRSLLALAPNNSLYFLSMVGLYFVIPEMMLFWRQFSLRTMLKSPNLRRTQIALIFICLTLFFTFPPSFVANGLLIKVVDLIPIYALKIALIFGLALFACLRFSHLRLETWLLLFNSLIMMKAFPWDRYVLPLMVVLWFLKSIGSLDSYQLDKTIRSD